MHNKNDQEKAESNFEFPNSPGDLAYTDCYKLKDEHKNLKNSKRYSVG